MKFETRIVDGYVKTYVWVPQMYAWYLIECVPVAEYEEEI